MVLTSFKRLGSFSLSILQAVGYTNRGTVAALIIFAACCAVCKIIRLFFCDKLVNKALLAGVD